MTNSATDRQIEFIRSLIDSKIENRDAAHDSFNGKLATGLSRATASKWIADLLSRPNLVTEVKVPEVKHDVPAGRYAIQVDGEGDSIITKFYRVDRPTEGRWAGFTFVKVQASDEFHPIRGKRERERILAAIALDPEGASLRYGREIGSCGVCGRTLTDETSREAGIGPICAGRMGWGL